MKVKELRDILHELPEDAEVWFKSRTLDKSPEIIHTVGGLYEQTGYFSEEGLCVTLTGYRCGS